MNCNNRTEREENKILVKEVHAEREVPGTSHDYLRDNEKCQKDIVNNPVKIGGHEIRQVGSLKVLSKTPLEDYFPGQKGKKQSKKKTKSKRQLNNAKDFEDSVTRTGVHGVESPSVESTTQQHSATDEAAYTEKQIQLEFYKYKKLKEDTEKRNSARQKQAEENYLEELENIAETWVEYKKRRNQLKESQGFSQPRSIYRKILPAYSRIGISIISRKYWNDDQDGDVASGKVEDGRQMDQNTTQQSSCKEVQEGLQKLVFVDEEDSE